MIGHQIYTRANYRYGSNTSGGGTWTVELSPEVLPPKVAIKLESGFSEISSRLAGGNHEGSLLRLFRPTSSTTMLSRTYYVEDMLTNRGTVQYSYGLVLNGDDRAFFLNRPRRELFNSEVFESYESFVRRVLNDGGKTKYSATFDQKLINPDPFQPPVTKEDWEKLIINEETFVDIFVGLCKAISYDERIVIVLPDDSNSQDFIFMVLSMLPKWFRSEFGAISRWVEAVGANSTPVLKGIQLVCFVGEYPEHNETAPIIDLTGNGKTRNTSHITTEEKLLAKWYWENIDDPEELDKLAVFMENTLKEELLQSLSFEILALGFWIWRNFEMGSNYNYEKLQYALQRLFDNFEAEDLTYFFERNSPILFRIFNSFSREVETITPSQILREVVVAICGFARAGVEVINPHTLEKITPDDYVQPLFNKICSGNRWDEAEIIGDYFIQVLDTNIENNLIIDSMLMLLESTQNSLISKAIKTLNSAIDTAIGKYFEHRNTIYYEYYKKILTGMKNKGRKLPHYNVEPVLFKQDVKKDPLYFCKIIERNRKDGKLPPPHGKLLDSILAIASLLPSEYKNKYNNLFLQMFWDAEDLKNPALLKKYIDALDEHKQTRLFVGHKIGVNDIRIYYTSMVDFMFRHEHVEVDDVHRLWVRLYEEVGFEDNDPLFLAFDEKLYSHFGVNLQTLFKTLTCSEVAKLYELSTHSKLHSGMLLHMKEFDDSVKSSASLFYATYDKWSQHHKESYLFRMEYWFEYARKSEIEGLPDEEWRLSRALLESMVDKKNKSKVGIAKIYLGLCNEGDSYEKLRHLYKALRLVITPPSHKYQNRDSVVVDSIGVLAKVYAIEVADVCSNEGCFNKLSKSAKEFNALYGVSSLYFNNISQIGESIVMGIRNHLSTNPPPKDAIKQYKSALYQFHPKHWKYSNIYGGNRGLLRTVVKMTSLIALALVAIALFIFWHEGEATINLTVVEVIEKTLPRALIYILAGTSVITSIIAGVTAFVGYIERKLIKR